MPLVVLFPLVLVRPNLLQARYTLFVLPGWAILGSLGIMILMDAVGRALAHPGGRWGTGAPLRGSVVTAATYGVGVMVIVGLAASQVDSLREIRALGGHGEDIRRLWPWPVGPKARSCRSSCHRPKTPSSSPRTHVLTSTAG